MIFEKNFLFYPIADTLMTQQRKVDYFDNFQNGCDKGKLMYWYYSEEG